MKKPRTKSYGIESMTKKNNDKKLSAEMCKWSSNNRANNKSKISHDIWHDIIWRNI